MKMLQIAHLLKSFTCYCNYVNLYTTHSICFLAQGHQSNLILISSIECIERSRYIPPCPKALLRSLAQASDLKQIGLNAVARFKCVFLGPTTKMVEELHALAQLPILFNQTSRKTGPLRNEKDVIQANQSKHSAYNHGDRNTIFIPLEFSISSHQALYLTNETYRTCALIPTLFPPKNHTIQARK